MLFYESLYHGISFKKMVIGNFITALCDFFDKPYKLLLAFSLLPCFVYLFHIESALTIFKFPRKKKHYLLDSVSYLLYSFLLFLTSFFLLLFLLHSYLFLLLSLFELLLLLSLPAVPHALLLLLVHSPVYFPVVALLQFPALLVLPKS